MRGNFDRFNSARVPCGNQDLRKALFKGEYMGKLLRVNIDSIFFIENVFFNFFNTMEDAKCDHIHNKLQHPDENNTRIYIASKFRSHK
jgi:hypothetical protein